MLKPKELEIRLAAKSLGRQSDIMEQIHREERDLLEEWIYATSLFYESIDILELLENTEVQEGEYHQLKESEDELKQRP